MVSTVYELVARVPVSKESSLSVEPVPPTAAIPPEFNTVGAGSTNQLADAIGGQSQQPIQQQYYQQPPQN